MANYIAGHCVKSGHNVLSNMPLWISCVFGFIHVKKPSDRKVFHSTSTPLQEIRYGICYFCDLVGLDTNLWITFCVTLNQAVGVLDLQRCKM